MDNFQNRIKLTRNSLGLSQAVLALKTGVSQPTVANWENGSHVPRQAVLEKISDVLGVSSSWLLTGTRNENEIPAQIYLQTPITHVPVFNWPDKPADLSSSAPTGFCLVSFTRMHKKQDIRLSSATRKLPKICAKAFTS